MLTDSKRRLSFLFLCAPNIFELPLHIWFSDVCFASSCGGASADADRDVNTDDKADADVIDGKNYIENDSERAVEGMINSRDDERYTQ